MEVKELRDLNMDRLGALEQSLRKQIFDARIKNFTNQLDDTASIRRMRRDLARVKTIQGELLNSDASDSASNEGADVEEPAVEAAAEADTSAEETD